MIAIIRSILASASLFAAVPATADLLTDDFAGTTRDTTKWLESESSNGSNGKVSISQNDALLVDGMQGKGGGAAYLTVRKVDWNDNFRVQFSLTAGSFTATHATHKAVVGLGIGIGTKTGFTLTSGFKTGLQVEIVRTSADSAPKLQLVARKNGAVLSASESVLIDTNPHAYELTWTVDPIARTILADLYMDGDLSAPVLSLSGTASAFTGLISPNKPFPGATLALLGVSSGKFGGPRFSASFDDFLFEGDLLSDDDFDDSGWSDDDSPIQGVDIAELSINLSTLNNRSGFFVISTRAYKDWTTVVLRKPGNQSKTQIIKFARDYSGTILSSTTRASTSAEKALFNSLFPPRVNVASVWAMYVPLIENQERKLKRVAYTSTPSPSWTIILTEPDGTEATRVIPLDGMNKGDGVATLSMTRFPHCVSFGGVQNLDSLELALRCGIENGIFEIVEMIPSSNTQVLVRRFHAMTGVVSQAPFQREATPNERSVIAFRNAPDQFLISDVQWGWARAIENEGDVAIVSVEQVDFLGVPAWKYRVISDAGQVIEQTIPVQDPG